MASQPGLLTDWPWQKLGSYKYVLLAPWIADSLYKLATSKIEDTNKMYMLTFPILLVRLLYGQLWISYSRFKTATGVHAIVDKSLDFEQIDRERNWDDQIILTALLFYSYITVFPEATRVAWWDTKGVILLILLHAGPVEFLYYWLHRALHHHYLYSRYHSHHHSSIVTEPITSVIHPFAEELTYFLLFLIPFVGLLVTKTGSVAAGFGYIVYIDFMNYLGHCNFEFIPKWLFKTFPPLKYLMYTPSFHSLHHTRFTTNYSLFMPFYDYVYGTLDGSSDELYENSLKEKEDKLDVVHLTHLTTLQSVFQLRLGFASLASFPYASKIYLSVLSPATYLLAVVMKNFGSTFVLERNKLQELHTETWVVPRYNYQYISCGNRSVNNLIEKALENAESRGAKVVSLGLLNQGSELNGYGMLYTFKKPSLKVKIVDGTSLAAAVILNSIPKGTKKVLLIGNAENKVAFVICSVLCERNVQVEMLQKEAYELIKLQLPSGLEKFLVLTSKYTTNKVWLVGDDLSNQAQKAAAKGTHFFPFSQFPPKILRKDCVYHSTPALIVPKEYKNQHSCENWLPRRVMSAWRAAGIIHALEDWKTNECGQVVTGVDKAWNAALKHGFVLYDHWSAKTP